MMPEDKAHMKEYQPCQTEAMLKSMRDYFLGFGKKKRSKSDLKAALEVMASACERYHTDDGVLALQREITAHRTQCSGLQD